MSRKQIIGFVLCILLVVLLAIAGSDNEQGHCAIEHEDPGLWAHLSAQQRERCEQLLKEQP